MLVGVPVPVAKSQVLVEAPLPRVNLKEEELMLN